MKIFNRIKLIATVGIILLGLILGGCDPRKQSPPPSLIPEVSVVTVQPQQVMLTTELPGRTSAHLVAEIRPQVNGLIQKRLFTEGSDVKAGQMLYQIDPAPFQAVLDNAKASLGRAEANLPAIRSRAERFKELLADKAVSQQDYDDAAAALKQTEADIQYWKATVETARINLGYTRIIAPISGRIGRSNVTDGALVTALSARSPGNHSTTGSDLCGCAPIHHRAAALDSVAWRKAASNTTERNQNKVKLILEDGTPYPLEGTLQFRDVTVDPTTGSVILRTDLSQSERCSSAGHVCPGRGEGGRQRAGHPDPPASGVPRPKGESRRADRGC